MSQKAKAILDKNGIWENNPQYKQALDTLSSFYNSGKTVDGFMDSYGITKSNPNYNKVKALLTAN